MRKSTDAVITCASAGITANQLFIPVREPSVLVNPHPTRQQVPRPKTDALSLDRTSQTAGSSLPAEEAPGLIRLPISSRKGPRGHLNQMKEGSLQTQ